MNALPRPLILALGGLLGVSSLSAQILYDGGVYSQNFDHNAWSQDPGNIGRVFTPNTDSLNPELPGGSVGWVGWYAATGTGSISTGVSPSTSDSDIRISDGTQNTQFSIYVFRTPGQSDGALGSIVVNALAGGTGEGFNTFGMQLVNNTGTTLTEFSLAFTGEQWRVSTNQTNAQSLLVSYQIGGSNLIDGTWTDIPELTFTGPQAQPFSPNGAFNIDGNLPENQVSLSHTVSGITWEPGTELWIRWFDINDSGNDHALGIDNVQFSTPIPEPSTFALLALAALAGAALLRHRRR